jgi:hypothetical protein
MRKIISQGPNTVMEGVFSSPLVDPSPRVREPVKAKRAKTPKSKRLQHRKKCLVVLLALLTSAPVFAASQEATADGVMSANQRAASSQSMGRYATLKQRQASAKKAGNPGQADGGRVYLDEYERVPQAVTRKRSTETVWLGKNGKSK